MLCGEIQNSANSIVITFIGRFVLNLKPSCYRVIYRARFPSWKWIHRFWCSIERMKRFTRRQRKQQGKRDRENEREREREISGVNGNPPVLGIDPSIGSHIKLQLLDITLPLSACSDGLDKKCLPKRMLLQGRYGFPALWEQQPHACCLLRNFLPHRVNPGALSSYWPTELLKKNV